MSVFPSLPHTDDIIRLNKKQKVALRKQRLGVRGRLAPGRRTGAPLHRGHYVIFTFIHFLFPSGHGVVGLAVRDVESWMHVDIPDGSVVFLSSLVVFQEEG